MHSWPMRTTLDLEEDILETLKRTAPKRGVSMGKLASDLIRKALAPDSSPPVEFRGGVPVIPAAADAETVTVDLVDRIRDEMDG